MSQRNTLPKDRVATGTGRGIGARVAALDLLQDRAAAMAKAFGRIDVLINCAGAYRDPAQLAHETPEETWDVVIDSNLEGTVPGMVERLTEGRSQDEQDHRASMIPLGRLADPDEHAAVASFMASTAASSTTGASIDKGGGIITV